MLSCKVVPRINIILRKKEIYFSLYLKRAFGRFRKLHPQVKFDILFTLYFSHLHITRRRIFKTLRSDDFFPRTYMKKKLKLFYFCKQIPICVFCFRFSIAKFKKIIEMIFFSYFSYSSLILFFFN